MANTLATETTVVIELCRSNSIGSHYYAPSVVEISTVSREEANRLLTLELVNGFFWREQEDATGN